MEEFNKHYLAGERVADYIRTVSVRETGLQRQLREETSAHPRAIMQIAPEQGQLFKVLVAMTNATRALEMGVFTGYSSLAIALALPRGGHITACDISEEYTAVARRYWQKAGVADAIDLRIGPAADTLRKLIGEGKSSSYDFAFIDADKPNYDIYYELSLVLVRPGGLIVLDNMLYHGLVPDPDETGENATALRILNNKIGNDTRVISILLPVADGITLAVKS